MSTIDSDGREVRDTPNEVRTPIKQQWPDEPMPPTKSANTMILNAKPLIGIVLLLVVAIGGFIGGLQYQKGKATSTTTATGVNQTSIAGQAGGFGGRAMDGGFGTVTAVSDTSITISERRTGSAKTYTISSSTTITDNGTTVAASDIQTGATVIIRTSSSTSTAATTIAVNPTMGAGPGAAPSSSSSSDTSTTQSSI